MRPTSSVIPRLLAKSAAGETLSADEAALLEQWLSLSKKNAALYARLRDRTTVANSLADLMAVQKRRSFREILAGMRESRSIRARRTLSVIAGLLLCILALSLWYGTYRRQAAHDRGLPDATAILPAFSVTGNHALITTSEGLSYSVDPGVRSLPGCSAIILSSRAVRYPRLKSTGYNRITTASQTCKVILSDGSWCVLDRRSSLRFPTSFTDTAARIVELAGTGFFNVRANSERPFTVSVTSNTGAPVNIVALGTAFLVQADPVKVCATLLHGKAQLTVPGKHATLRPGISANIDADAAVTFSKADTAHLLDWLQPAVRFHQLSLQSFLDSVAAYYNVTMIYRGHFDTVQLGSAGFDPYDSVGQILDRLEKEGMLSIYEVNRQQYTLYR